MLFSFKKKGFKLEVPFYLTNIERLLFLDKDQKILAASLLVGSSITLFFVSRYLLSNRKVFQDTKIQKQINDKKFKREIEIKMIQKRANESYINECKNNGLVIVEAYYGSTNVINELMCYQDRILFLENNPIKKKKVIDVTIPLRFQVQDSNLNLIANSKKHLFGFYNPSEPHERNSLFIKFKKVKKQNDIFFNILDIMQTDVLEKKFIKTKKKFTSRFKL